MTTVAGDVPAWPVKAATRDKVVFWVTFAVGATGAVGTTTVDDPQITITRTGVGTYNLTYPAVPTGGRVLIGEWELLAADATPTAASFILTAKSVTAGTATFVAVNGTAAAEIESGSTLSFKITCQGRV